MTLALAFFIFSVVVSGLALYAKYAQLKYKRELRLAEQQGHGWKERGRTPSRRKA